MKHLLTLLLTLSLAWSASAATILDRVAVVVDDSVIMDSEIMARIVTAVHNLESQNAPMPPIDLLRREVTNAMILEQLQLQMAERASVRISDAQLTQTIADIARRNGMDLDSFIKALPEQGMSYTTLREQIRMQMLIQRVQRGHVGQRVHVSDDEITAFLSSEEGRQLTAPEYRLEHVQIPAGADAETLARNLMDAVRSGQTPAAAAQRAGSSVSYNDLGWRKPDDVPSLFADAVTRLEAGQIAGPFAGGNGLHLIYLAERRGTDRHVVQQTHARHILVKPSEVRSDDQARDLLLRLREHVLNGADFGDFARQYSEDIGSGSQGGDLGWAMPGQFVPAFEATMNRLQPGQIAEPIRSEFGWHLIQVLDRRQQDMGPELQRNLAHQHLFERKYEDELQAWLVKIRDEAYVDIKIQ